MPLFGGSRPNSPEPSGAVVPKESTSLMDKTKSAAAKVKDSTVKTYGDAKDGYKTSVEPKLQEEASKFKRWVKDGPLALKITCFLATTFCAVISTGELLKAIFGKGIEHRFTEICVATYALIFSIMGIIVEGSSLSWLDRAGGRLKKYKKSIEHWAKFLQRCWGRGIFYLFIAIMQFGMATFWGYIAGTAMFIAAFFCFLTGKLLSSQLNKLSDDLLAAYSSQMADSVFANKEAMLEEEKREHLRMVFDSMDTDGSGYLDPSELSIVVKNLGAQFSQDELMAIFNLIDDDGNGQIAFEEFAKWWFGSKKVKASWL